MTSINWFTVLRGYRNEISPEDMGKYVLGTYHRENKKHTAQIPVPIREILTWLGVELKEVDYKMAQSSNSDPTGLIPVISDKITKV
ncbi:MAG: hypothetical protein E6Q89_00675 [Bacteroidia bacterium]|nr:MAG: hypothetical protein E6Q89_00675 [Bacteroidia bacterium]